MTTPTSVAAARQAPLRKLYETEPDAALIVKRVWTSSGPDADPFHGDVTPGPYGFAWRYGIDAKLGGFGDAPNPGEILCAALAACLDGTLRMLADHLGVELERVTVEVKGDVDVRGALVVIPGVKVGFRSISATVSFEAPAATDRRLLDVLSAQAERSCITLDTLRSGVLVELSWQPIAG